MRLSVRSKLLGTSGVLIAFVVAVGVFSLVNLGTVASQTTSLSDDVVEPLAELGIARAEFNENRALLNNHMLETTRQAKAVIDTRMTGNSRTIDEQLAAFELTIQTDGGREAFADLRASLAAYQAERDEVLRLSNTSTQAEAYAHNKEKTISATAAVVDAFTAL